MARQDELQRLQNILINRRSELLQRLDEDMDGMEHQGEPGGDSADVAFGSGSEELASQLAEMESRELEQIENALGKMKAGRYGACESCEVKIPVLRLKALPYSTLCVRCQQEMEEGPDGLDEPFGDWDRVGDGGDLMDEREVDLTDLELDVNK